ncbi:MFS transporter [Neorhizobium sp. JUb45]|uniref:MFS transporter n=1 Tax=Neorhizobium sp. JUb45 TaxID=2485113 RepID=UPI00104FA28B|nr:MFS transporter [Neorhizobium sp. JUb45]TCQ99050.1 MFS transporter [Neorhizobium sp. JUb45]
MIPNSVRRKSKVGAWGGVVLGFLTLALAFTVRGSLSLAMPAWQTEFGWSRSFISGIAAAALLVIAVVAPFAGSFVDRRGSRPLLVFGLAAIGSGVVLGASAQAGSTSWLLPIGFAAIGALGFGTIAQHVVAAAITQRIEHNRGLAVGIGTAGSTAGQLLLMPALAFLMQRGEWRLAFLLLAASCFILIPVAWRVLAADGKTSTRHRPGHWCTNKISTIVVYAVEIFTSLIDPGCRTNITPPAVITSVK